MTMTDHGRLADESGYVAVWTVVIGGALMVAGGVVYDSADKANEARRVTMVANEAGRAAAQEITSDAISGRAAQIDPSRAAGAAREYLDATGMDGTVSVDGTTVTVTTSQPWSPKIMPVLQPDTLTSTVEVDLERAGPGGAP
ncbi:hypothetical protein B277_12066 [Janibacter hoylei PVAS-1]|uniref:Uncharacterized protein n=2 Tax=Janibacter TaxID=53457 RepID=K1DVX7_9MICO|nr:hypothetical protein B277_12066 [Janibacter hoylei PVAS-1]RWU85727.1 hypothetical protein CWN80_01815 [Janibacter hoylei PVAS-1]